MKKGIIFDMDGTLWDSAANVAESWNLAIKQDGSVDKKLTEQDIQGVMGKTMDVIADILFPEMEKEARMKLLDQCCSMENDYLREHGGVLYPKLEETLSELKEKYPNAIIDGISPNLESMESVRNAFKEVTGKYGCVDILVNNAGISENTPFMNYTEETFDKVMDLNVKGVFNTTRVAAECMVAKGNGVILSTSSMVSISGQPSGFAYPASKFAVNGLTVSLARELGPKGIRVNAVAPGITETDMMKAVPKEVIEPMIERIPLRRLGQPEDIANAFVFLASDEASYITGVILSVDGMARS